MNDKNVKNVEYIYCMTNKSFNTNLVKIGWTTNEPSKRAQQLYTTGVPTPFTIEFIIKTHDGRTLESRIHSYLSRYRENNSREFFRIELSVLREILTDKLKLILVEPEHTEPEKNEYHQPIRGYKTYERCSAKLLKQFNELRIRDDIESPMCQNITEETTIDDLFEKFRYVPETTIEDLFEKFRYIPN